MTVRPFRLVIAYGAVPLLVAAALCLARPGFLRNIEYAVYDALLRATPTRPPAGRIVIVDVDERSLSAIGQWPWRRDVMGELVDELRHLGAAVIALDIIFAEPDRYDGAGPTPDAMLADTLRGGRVVLGYALTFDGASDQTTACVDHPLGLAIVRAGDEHADTPFFSATSAICNLLMLTRAAAASGFLNAAPDGDGILRRVPILAELQARVYPGLALAAVTTATRASGLALRLANVNSSALAIGGGMTVPLDGKSNMLVRYRGPKRTFPYVSAVDVLTGDIRPGAFANKLVFIGTTALGTREVVSTPLDTLFTGVEVQATVADNLLQRDFIYRPEHGVVLETLAVLALGLLPVLLIVRLGSVGAAATSAALAVAAWGGSVWLLASSGAFVSPLYPLVGLAMSLAAMTAAALTVERRRADQADHDKAGAERLMIESLLSLTDIRDAETGRHSRRIQEYTKLLAVRLSTHPEYRDYLSPERVELLATLAPLHDIGKIGVPDHLLKKTGPLTDDELLQIRTHPAQGRDAIARAERAAGIRADASLDVAKDIVYTHHERWDGSGYPEGLRGEDIPIPGRIVAIVDVYDAVRSPRPYHTPCSHDTAVDEIAKRRGTHFDPAVVDAFLDVSERFRRLSEISPT